MFYYHKITKINNEEVLYLYIDNNYEFAWDFVTNKRKQRKLKKEIKRYLKKHKVVFNGIKVFCIINGLVVALAMSDVTLSSINSYNYHIPIMPPNNYSVQADVPMSTQEIKEVEDDSNKQVVSEVTTQNVNNETLPNISNNKVSSKTSSNNSVNQEEKKTSSSGTNEVIKDVDEKVQAEDLITLYRSNGKVLKIALEEYLIGVVGAEMPASFNTEALKAQSLVARTYTLKLIASGRKLTDTVSTQSYKDNNQLKSMWGSDYNLYYNKIKKAVESTKGEVIKYQNEYIEAVYHSTNNGQTSDAIDVWGNSVPYLKSVDSKWDKVASSYLRTVQKDYQVLNLVLGLNINSESSVEVLSRTSNGSIKELSLEGTIYTGLQLRTLLDLRSTDFDIIFGEQGITITTRGYGHGVGMSQYGANGMAKEGYNFHQIIKHYYKGVSINKL